MKLYHGTSERHLDSILKNGILPRSQSNVPGNWEHTVQGSTDNVYLTKGYAPYFAATATEEGERWLIVEVDKDRLLFGNRSFYGGETDVGNWERFLPDEDYVESVLRGLTKTDIEEQSAGLASAMAEAGYWEFEGGVMERTGWVRDNIKIFDFLASNSLEKLGNVGWRGPIPPRAITRVSLYDPKSNPTMTMSAMDPTISTLNWAICAHKYEELTRWFLGYPNIDPNKVMGSYLTMDSGEAVRRKENFDRYLNMRSLLEKGNPEDYVQATIKTEGGEEETLISDFSMDLLNKKNCRLQPCPVEEVLDGGTKIKDVIALIDELTKADKYTFERADAWENEVVPNREGIEIIELAQTGIGAKVSSKSKKDAFASVLAELSRGNPSTHPLVVMERDDPVQYKELISRFGSRESLERMAADSLLDSLENVWRIGMKK